MPTQITHAVLGKRFYSTYFSQFPQQEFLIGNSFPDIRRVAKVDRTLTHPIVSTLAECQSAPDGFAAGMRFHAFVDMVRQRAMRTYGVYESHESSPQYITATKLSEDELCCMPMFTIGTRSYGTWIRFFQGNEFLEFRNRHCDGGTRCYKAIF